MDSLRDHAFATTVERMLGWAGKHASRPLGLGLACCGLSVGEIDGCDGDDGTRPSVNPRHADLLVVAGTLTYQLAPRLQLVHAQMPDPKLVLAVGACAAGGGPYAIHGYSVVKGLDRILPVDLYLPGCPPTGEAFSQALLRLRERLASLRRERA